MIRRLFAALMAFLILGICVPALPETTDTMPYSITVDCFNNIVTVYSTADGTIVRQMICSSGTESYPSPRGTFIMPEEHKDIERGEWYVFQDGYGKYGTRIWGNYLFHSYLFTRMEDDAVNWNSYAAMGTNASHGCIRLYIEDAMWIAEHCFAGTQVELFDGDAREDYIKELLYGGTYSSDSGMTYRQYASIASDETELGYGSSGAEVAQFKARLIELGLYAGEADDFYGADLVKTVKAIQASMGLAVTGVAGESFLKMIRSEDAPSSNISTLEKGMKGPAVEELQAGLSSIGLFGGEIDGDYDDETRDAVILFERMQGLAETGIATVDLERDIAEKPNVLSVIFKDGYALKYVDVAVENAVIKATKNLNVRSEKNTESEIAAKLEPGTEVSVLEHGEEWTKIAFDGGVGYVRTAYLSFSQAQRRIPKYVAADAEHPAFRRITADHQTISSKNVTYGLVNTKDRLLVRESPQEGANLSFMLPSQTEVRVISVNNSWAFLSYGGKTGFAKLTYIKTTQTRELGGVVSAGASSAQTAGDAEEVYAYPKEESGANVYSAACESGAPLLTLNQDARAAVIFENNTWTKVKVGEVTGYVPNENVLIGTNAEIDAYIANCAAAKSVYGVVDTGTDASLNMRSGASPDADIVLKLENGAIVLVKSDDGAWCEIEYDWKTGYVMSKYVLEMDESGVPHDVAVAKNTAEPAGQMADEPTATAGN